MTLKNDSTYTGLEGQVYVLKKQYITEGDVAYQEQGSEDLIRVSKEKFLQLIKEDNDYSEISVGSRVVVLEGGKEFPGEVQKDLGNNRATVAFWKDGVRYETDLPQHGTGQAQRKKANRGTKDNPENPLTCFKLVA